MTPNPYKSPDIKIDIPPVKNADRFGDFLWGCWLGWAVCLIYDILT